MSKKTYIEEITIAHDGTICVRECTISEDGNKESKRLMFTPPHGIEIGTESIKAICDAVWENEEKSEDVVKPKPIKKVKK